MSAHKSYECFVAGNPAPQGSKRWLGGKTIIDNCKRLPEWRADIRRAFLRADGAPAATFEDSAVAVILTFVMPRPKYMKNKTGIPMTKKPDDEKLSRAVSDAITSAGVWNDDCQVVERHIYKRYAEPNEASGVHIAITSALCPRAVAFYGVGTDAVYWNISDILSYRSNTSVSCDPSVLDQA